MNISPGAAPQKERQRSSKRRNSLLAGLKPRFDMLGHRSEDQGDLHESFLCSDKGLRALAGASLPNVVVDLFSDFLSLGLGERRPGKRSVEVVQDEDFQLRLRRLFLSPIRHGLEQGFQ